MYVYVLVYHTVMPSSTMAGVLGMLRTIRSVRNCRSMSASVKPAIICMYVLHIYELSTNETL